MKTLGLVFLTFTIGMPIAFPAFAQFRDPIGPYATPEAEQGSTNSRGVDPDEVQSRGLSDKFKGKDFKQLQPATPPPARLCRTETIQMTQCKCFNQTECQALTALFPNSCPPGSSHCEFMPMAHGSMPPLPQNLCHYEVPVTVTECSCKNAAGCQLLSPFCPTACPAGSTSCTCRPLKAGDNAP